MAFFLLTALVVVAADQLTKLWVIAAIPVGGSLPVLGPVRIVHATNTGGAFSLFTGYTPWLIAGSLIGIAVLVYVFTRRRSILFLDSRLGVFLLGLVLGGTSGNLIDRVRLGYVTDFFSVGRFPTFNVADASATIGIAAIALLFLSGLDKKA